MIIQLLDLREIRERWGVGEDRIYRAVERGELRAYGRPGRQKYYAEAELKDLLEGPSKPPRPDNGRYQQGFAFDVDVAA